MPKRVSNVTSWKLKSESSGLLAFAVDFITGVSSRNTSFRLAFLYSVDVLSVIPSLLGVAKPSISPSVKRSCIVANCLL